MNHRRDLFVPSISLDRSSGVPLHRQIYGEIARGIGSNEIYAGARLPSTRALAKMMGVSRNTVLTAYDELAADDLIRGEQGSGMRVNSQSPPHSAVSFRFNDLVRAAHYPLRVLAILDPDGNSLYLNL